RRDAEASPILVSARPDRGGRGAGAALRGHEGLGRPGPAHPCHRPGQASGGGVLPRPAGPPPDPAGIRGPVRPPAHPGRGSPVRSEEHTSELQSRSDLVCRLLLEKKNKTIINRSAYLLPCL